MQLIAGVKIHKSISVCIANTTVRREKSLVLCALFSFRGQADYGEIHLMLTLPKK